MAGNSQGLGVGSWELGVGTLHAMSLQYPISKSPQFPFPNSSKVHLYCQLKSHHMSALAKKLRVGPGMTLLTLHAPEDFAEEFGQLPDGVKITTSSSSPDQVHWFVMSRAQLEKELSRVLK